jgi:hypothetical protein
MKQACVLQQLSLLGATCFAPLVAHILLPRQRSGEYGDISSQPGRQ